MTAQRNRVYYCDDQDRFLKKFIANHEKEFEVFTSLDISSVKDDVQKLIRDGKRPDIILLDLFHPRESADFEERRVAAEEKLKELTAKIKEIRPYIDSAWKPEGIQALLELRSVAALDTVPILFYTQRGLVFLSEENLAHIYENDSDWMLKDSEVSSPITERARINQMISRYREKHNWSRTYVVPFATFFAGVALSVAINFVSSAAFERWRHALGI